MVYFHVFAVDLLTFLFAFSSVFHCFLLLSSSSSSSFKADSVPLKGGLGAKLEDFIHQKPPAQLCGAISGSKSSLNNS